VYPFLDVLANVPDEMRELLDASVVKSMHWISSVKPDSVELFSK